MNTVISQFKDKARGALHKFSHFLGENDSIRPTSINDRKRAEQSVCVDLPAFKSLLPYETYDEEGVFINRNSVGFGLHINPTPGADESLMKSLAELFKNKLPIGVDCSVLLFKHHYLAGRLSESYVPILKKGGIYAELARMSIKYHLKAIKKGYKNGRNVPAQLADYSCYLFVSMKPGYKWQEKITRLREEFESELKVMGFSQYLLGKNEFTALMRAFSSPNLNETSWPTVDASDELLSDNIPAASSIYEIDDLGIDVSSNDNDGYPHTTRIVNCEISNWPKQEFALWQTPDLFANLLKPEHGIQCPFLLSFTVRGVNQEKMKSVARSRAKSLNVNSNAIQSFLNPGMQDEAKEWNLVHQEGSKDNLSLVPTFYNLMLFTTKDKEREHVAKAISAYRQMGFTLTQARCKQWLRYLASLPFMLSEGLFSSLEAMGMTKKLSHYNVANLLPVVSDFKGSKAGLLLPTYRHQMFFLDAFDDKNLPITNFNRLTVASTGAGKSYLQLAMILDGLSRGHKIFVIDLGESYKHLCDMVGGTYIDASTVSLNPFTLFDFEGVTEIAGENVNDYIQIRDLLAIMASPNEPLSDVQKSWLLDAVLSCWKKHGQKACIDNVLESLREQLQNPESKDDRRLKDLLVLLGKYGSQGVYGDMFNSETPVFSQSDFVVLEMGGLKSNPELLTIVMFVMIVIIQGQFYQSDRRIKKQCVIDEAWQFLGGGANPIAAQFIEQGFRTARKHNGGFSVITQHLADTSKTVQGQAIAASADTKIIMRQGALKEYIEKHPNTFDPLQKEIVESFGEAKMQGFSNLMVQFGNAYTFHRYFSDPFLRVLFSTSGDEFGAVEALVKSGVSLTDAVNQVAQQFYKDELCD